LKSRPILALAVVFAVACTGSDDATDRAGGPEGPRIDAPAIDADIVLTAPPEEGAGEIPTFAWEPVEGAASYRLGILDARGNPIWSWEGSETSVVLGGVSGRQPEEGGPLITPGSRWSVIAYDGAGSTIAVSEIRPVSP
jgi:hypothetical protein